MKRADQSRSAVQTRRNIVAALAGIPALGIAGGCTRLLPGQGPPPRLYTLTPKSTFDPGLPRVEWQLVLEVPYAPAALNTTRIGIMTAPTVFEYYAGASWTDRAPVMVQTLMIESFENSRRIVSIGREAIGLRADFVLKSELREFQTEAFHPDGARVHTGINTKLVRMPQRDIVAAADFWEKIPTPPDDMEAVIKAFDAALGKVLRRLVSWALVTGQTFWTKDPAG